MKTYEASICGNFRHYMEVEAHDVDSAWEIAQNKFAELNCKSDIHASMWEVEEVEEITFEQKVVDQRDFIHGQIGKYLEMVGLPIEEWNEPSKKIMAVLNKIDETKENMKEITNV